MPSPSSSSSIPTTTQRWILQHKPSGNPDLSPTSPTSTFSLQTTDIPTPKSNELLLRNIYFSNDPAQRTWISSVIPADRLYAPPVNVGETMRAGSVAQVVKAGDECKTKEGAYVMAYIGWTEYGVAKEAECQPAPEIPGLSMTHYLGALGLTGWTAWTGLVESARCTKDDDVVVVSGAAGATGSMVVQIAKKMLGCKRVIGIAGGAKKCEWVVQAMGADECLDYKSASFKDDLIRATPENVNVYFDNVGGEILDLMLTRMKTHGRIAACGAISEYNEERAPGLRNYVEVITQRIEIKGFIVIDYMSKFGEITNRFLEAFKEGKIRVAEDMETVVETKFEDVPKTWWRLYEGGNTGKLVTKLV